MLQKFSYFRILYVIDAITFATYIMKKSILLLITIVYLILLGIQAWGNIFHFNKSKPSYNKLIFVNSSDLNETSFNYWAETNESDDKLDDFFHSGTSEEYVPFKIKCTTFKQHLSSPPNSDLKLSYLDIRVIRI